MCLSLTREQKGVERPKLVRTFPRAGVVSDVSIFNSEGHGQCRGCAVLGG